MFDRRRAERKPVEIFFNKYLEGHPYLARTVDLSEGGVLCQGYIEPARGPEGFPVEILLPEATEPLWIWARRIGRRGTFSVLRFMGMAADDERRLVEYLSRAA